MSINDGGISSCPFRRTNTPLFLSLELMNFSLIAKLCESVGVAGVAQGVQVLPDAHKP